MKEEKIILSYIHSKYLMEPIPFYGEPIYYKFAGIYGFLMPFCNKVFFFHPGGEYEVTYSELDGWQNVFTSEDENQILEDFSDKIKKQENIPAEFVDIVNKNFNDLI
jgi:hypothetical protein